MTYLRKTLLILTPIALLLLLVAVSAQQQAHQQTQPGLGLEVALSAGPLYFPAAAAQGKTISANIPVPVDKNKGPLDDQISAVRIVPRMQGDKVQVTVYAVYGDISQVKSCSELTSHKMKAVASYLASNGDMIAVSELRDLGGRLGQGPVTFQVVSKRIPTGGASAASPMNNGGGGACGCGSCNGLQCCPNPRACLGCGTCGLVCCNSGGELG